MKQSKTLKTVLIVCAALTAVYFLPFITVETKDASGSIWRVPFGTWVSGEGEGRITFASLRSSYAIGKDAENALHSYEESTCYGSTYFYDEANDRSLISHEESGVLPTTLVYTYEQGNACDGWSTDAEIAWEFGDLKEIDWNLSAEEAMENTWFVIEDGKASNIGAYNDFSRMLKQGVYCMQRTCIYESGKLVKVVDIQLLENAHYRVAIAAADSYEEAEYARLSDQENENGEKEVCVYNGSFLEETPYLLFTVK